MNRGFYCSGILSTQCPLKNAGNDCHFSSNGTDFSSNRADPPDDGNNLLQKALGFGIFGSRKTYGIWICMGALSGVRWI